MRTGEIRNCEFSSGFRRILFNLKFRHLRLKSAAIYFILCVLLCTELCCRARGARSNDRVYINQFAVLVSGGDSVARAVARRNGFINKGQIGNLKGYYLFENHNIQKRSTVYSHHHHTQLKKDPEVLWVEQQHVKHRVKRDLSGSTGHMHTNIDLPDPLYLDQWYLHGGGRGGFDMHVEEVWRIGYTGKGVVVTILDDGIQTNHPDLVQNYDRMASTDINGGDNDPMPQDNGDNKHGTRCAGEVSATAFNEFCGVGVAYNASIGGVRMLDGTVTDDVEAKALSLNPNHIHIYSASWGPEDDGKTVDGPGPLAKRAFVDGVTSGRGGKGSIFVWASGNGGRYSDNCNCDGYTNSIYTLSISSASQAGAKPWYLEECTSTLATTYSSGTPGKDRSIVTVDMDTTYFKQLLNNKTPDRNSLCTKSHTGTSASAPIAAAICALALDANPSLTWRDMQYIVIMSSRPEPLQRESGWVKNAVGRRVSTKFGYGLMDATAMVKLAEEWTTVPPQHICESRPDSTERIIPNKQGGRLEVSMKMDACVDTPDAIRYLEHVQVKVTLQFLPRGNLRIVLISPSGTPSNVLLPRPYDTEDGSFNNWPLLSVHFWGETGSGDWKLIIINDGNNQALLPGKLFQWNMILYGTDKDPVNLKSRKKTDRSPPNYLLNNYNSLNEVENEAFKNPCARDKNFYSGLTGVCVEECPKHYYGDQINFVCTPCSQSCNSCYGPLSTNCLSCPNGSFLMEDYCVPRCPEGYYEDIPHQACLPCHSSCATCRGKPDVCHSCKPGLFLLRTQCLAACPEHMYDDDDNMCKECNFKCKTCWGPSEKHCLNCSNSYLLNGTCIGSCPEPYYASGSACYRCDQSCQSCRDKNQCDDCIHNWVRRPDNLCEPPGDCKAGMYFDIVCKSCHPTCASCYGGNDNHCLSCHPPSLLHEGRCLPSCPSGFYGENSQCLPCHETCISCVGSFYNQCQSCHRNLILHQFSCVESCPDKWFRDGTGVCMQCHSICATCSGPTNSDCITCPSGYHLLMGTCHFGQCPMGYYEMTDINSECLPCHHLCKTCTDMGPTNCLSCHSNATLKGNVCFPCLDNEYLDPTSMHCHRCHPNCRQCSGATENDCEACHSPLRLDTDLQQCLSCCAKPGDAKSRQCCICDDNQDTCTSFGGHTRSVDQKPQAATSDSISDPMEQVVPVIVTICTSAVLLFCLLFGILQIKSHGCCRYPRKSTDYQRVPNPLAAKFDTDLEKVALTQEDPDEEEEEIYQKA